MSRLYNLRNKVFILFCLLPFLSACVAGKALKTGTAKDLKSSGTYSLILYGGNYGEDIATLAILDREDDNYSFDVYAPDFAYKILPGLGMKDAMARAESFISMNVNYSRKQFSSILDETGAEIAYELRPLYYPLAYGTDDVMDTDYRIVEGKVRVFIRLKPEIEKQIMRFEIDADR